MYGNGLRPDIWERFRERFGVAEVGEFFNSRINGNRDEDIMQYTTHDQTVMTNTSSRERAAVVVVWLCGSLAL
jgi:hypothetical protein